MADDTAALFAAHQHRPFNHHREIRRCPEASELVDEAARSPSQDVDLAVNAALATLADLDRSQLDNQ